MIIKKFIICDYINSEAKTFEFSDGANIIYSKDNTSGKSSVLKSLVYGLGMNITKFPSGWNYKDLLFKIVYEHNGKEGYIIRHDKAFAVDDCIDILSESEYSKWFTALMAIKIKLPLKSNDTVTDVYASVPLLPFYIDQDKSWKGTLYKNTTNLNFYKSSAIPGKILEYVLGISNDDIINLEEEKSKLNGIKSILSNQTNVLKELKNKFLVSTSKSATVFDEVAIKEEISTYLKYAGNLSIQIQNFKAKIYTKQIQLDSELNELIEVEKLLNYLKTSYSKIRYTCPQCNSHLTKEQSIQRVKITNTQINAQILKTELEAKIKSIRNEITLLQEQNINLDEEYIKLLHVAQVKQGELTLQQHIEDKAQEASKVKYSQIKNELSEKIEDVEDNINKLNKQINELLKKTAERKDEIKKFFNVILENIRLSFPEAKLNYEFLDFKEIKESGSVDNQVFFCLYMAYTKTLFKYSEIYLPFVLDAVVKDELDTKNVDKIYKFIEETILLSKRQTFVAMLENKFEYIKGDYNKIELTKDTKILQNKNYPEILSEFENVFMRLQDAKNHDES